MTSPRQFIEQLEEDYAPNDDIFTEEDPKVNYIKHLVYEELSDPAKKILLLYAELGSLRKVGKYLGVSATTVYWYIKALRKTIKEKLKEYDTISPDTD